MVDCTDNQEPDPGYSTTVALSVQVQVAILIFTNVKMRLHTNLLLVTLPFLFVNESNETVTNVPSLANIAFFKTGADGSVVKSKAVNLSLPENSTENSSTSPSVTASVTATVKLNLPSTLGPVHAAA